MKKPLLFLLVLFFVFPGTLYSKTTIRVQTWHLGENPWRSAWDEFKGAVEEKFPDIKIQFDPVTYGEKEMVFTNQSEAKVAADIVHFSYRPIHK